MSHARPATTTDDAATYRRVVEALRGWEINPGEGFSAEHQLAAHLDAALNDGGGDGDGGGGDYEVQRTPSGTADVAVDGTVAVLLYREFGPQTVARFRSVVEDVGDAYDYLVVLGHDLPGRDLDRWRMGKARYTASRADLADVTHLSHGRGEETPCQEWPSALWHYAEPLVALLAIVIGVELAVLVELQFGEFTPLLGPGVTIVTVLALMALLVLLYQRTEV